MQDRYAGDVGDFGKFALLQTLFGTPSYRLGVIWYLFPDEPHNADGRNTGYLKKPDFLDRDKEICDKLSAVVNGNRSVAALEAAKLLPANTVCFSERLDFHLKYPSQNHRDKDERTEKRKAWLVRAINSVSGCNVIFLDPDNGIEIPSCSAISQMKSGKFAYLHEIKELAKGKEATVIYHHLNRHKTHGTHDNQIQIRTRQLREYIDPNGRIFALRFSPYSPRAYFILTDRSTEDRIMKVLLRFRKSTYGKHWDSYYEESERR